MTRLKIDYGIDLGTTNSAICRMEKGVPVVIKTDVLKDVMPSCVSFTKRKSCKAGEAAYNDLKSDKLRAFKYRRTGESNAVVEFKRTMATNTRYHSSYMERDYSSEELSGEVLKTLKSFVTDENVSSAVITVPAKFDVNQKTATLEAAKLAGFKRCELLQEPIAAAMAYGLTAESKNGIWMVFDFGGGTFDAAFIKVEDGIMQVFDTAGDNYLGGKNLDLAIADKIIIPYLLDNYCLSETMADPDKRKLLCEAMKTYAEPLKNQLSFKEKEDVISNLGDLGEDEDGEEIELDLTVTQEEVFEVMRPYFQRAVDICKDLLKRNHLTGEQIDKLILVGGPTHSPLVRQMLREQVTPNVDTSIDPMTAVSTGAALYASTLDAEIEEADIAVNTVKLDISYEATSVETEEWVSVALAPDVPMDKVWVEFRRSDNAWASGKVEIDKTGNVVEAQLLESKPNSFTILCYDDRGNQIPCFPSEITIIQGTKVGSATLPYNIGIARWDSVKKRGVFQMAKGLEKNKPIPAVGVVNGLKTSQPLRPGLTEDTLSIPVYQTELFEGAEGKTASLNIHVADVVITGDEVEELIPADSPVDVTLKVGSSEQMTLEVHFLASDITVEKALFTGKKHSVEDAALEIENLLSEAQHSIGNLEADGIDTAKLEAHLQQVKDDAENNTEKIAVLDHLKGLLREIEEIEDSTAWDRLEKDLREEFERLEKAQSDLGNEKSARLVEQLRSQTDQVIRAKNINLAREVREQITSLFVQLTMVYQCMGAIKYCYNRFDEICWKNPARARQLAERGMEAINNQPTVESLRPITIGLIELMPDKEAAKAGGMLKKECS